MSEMVPKFLVEIILSKRASLNSKKNTRAHKRKSNMEN